ncbi:hypothetical protein J1N35_003672 [Gossypium stocksii]|uniref:Uncharacterized protein n=1 Tax=Gossypium stocksii TaxID=47602 RepID=A0A9D4AFC4_9ROSI|nr:hypothetical protein J1N35_003672 [Gossypium stocksii]
MRKVFKPNQRIGILGKSSNKDSIEHGERRLTELGHRTVEILAHSHIFRKAHLIFMGDTHLFLQKPSFFLTYSNKIEVAYQEAVALKRQED